MVLSARARPGIVAPQRSAPTPVPAAVHFFSDFACPWCYVGKQRLQKAVRQLAQTSGIDVQIRWNPYIIDPYTKEEGEDYLAYNLRRWGSDAWTQSLRASGAPDGARFSNWRTWPNTLMAHQLVALAEEEGLADEAVDMLFERTYEEGGNVSLLPELEGVADRLGLPMRNVHDALVGRRAQELQARVLERDAAAKQQLRISGVPHSIAAAGPSSAYKYSLRGAQQPERLAGAIRQVAAEAAAAVAASGSGAGSGLLVLGPHADIEVL